MDLRVRPLSARDRDAIATMTRGTGLFRDEEVLVALEVFDGVIATGGTGDYRAVGAEVDGTLAGWIAWGPTLGTVGTWHLYWIVVEAGRQGLGIGTALIEEMERELQGVARVVAVETSGRTDYGPTCAFYERRGYEAVSRVRDYYAPGDDMVLFVKYFSWTARP